MRHTLLIAVLLIAACQSQPPNTEPLTLDDGPLIHADGQRRSLVFDTGYHRTLAANDPEAPYAWWDDRRDHHAATYAGYEWPTYLYAHTRTVDRVTDFGGHPRPTGSHTTHRGRVMRGMR